MFADLNSTQGGSKNYPQEKSLSLTIYPDSFQAGGNACQGNYQKRGILIITGNLIRDETGSKKGFMAGREEHHFRKNSLH